jgi:hypothetical protein
MHTALNELLGLIENQPSAYLGTSRNTFSGLIGFISGYASGCKYAHHDPVSEPFPTEFNNFVKHAMNAKHGMGKYGAKDHWFDIIILEAQSEEQAFEMFYELWRKFGQQPAERTSATV